MRLLQHQLVPLKRIAAACWLGACGTQRVGILALQSHGELPCCLSCLTLLKPVSCTALNKMLDSKRL